MYALAADLLVRFDATELAQVATPAEHPVVAPALLRLTIEGADRSAYTPEQIVAADAAAARIGQALGDADNDIDLYLGARYDLPITPVPQTLVRVACDLARYQLYDDAAPEEVRDRYKAARRVLEHLAKGMLKLGLDTEPAPENAPQVSGGARVFTERTLEDF
jgi:phage gp36-like protein